MRGCLASISILFTGQLNAMAVLSIKRPHKLDLSCSLLKLAEAVVYDFVDSLASGNHRLYNIVE